jgi:hypothetical protein
VQSDFNTNLDPAFRVSLTGQSQETQLGAPVKGISTSWGDIKNCPDVFVRDERQLKPFELDFPALAVANVASSPPSALLRQRGCTAANKFGAGHAGNYYYLVTGLNAAGQSTGVGFGAGHGCRWPEGHLHADSLGGCAGDRLRDLS